MTSKRFPILFDGWYRILSLAVLLPPSDSFVEVEGDEVRVEMGWAFRARFPRSAVAATEDVRGSSWCRGVHGFAGRWLVNGSGRGILTIHLSPTQRGRVLGFPVRLRELMVSVADPAALAAVLTEPD